MLVQTKGPSQDTSLHCETTDTGLVHHVVRLLTCLLSLVITTFTNRGMARLSGPVWLINLDSLPVCRQSPCT